MTTDGERLARLEEIVSNQARRIAELEKDRKNAVLSALLLVSSGFAILFGIIARKAGVMP